ncbi:MAG: RNA methyltransferase [Desulfobulbaceae bacterium DB1]|nr:MAG: RNA methyltransferase [Desulfobulbaceae bacterium DB1]
MNPDAVSVVLVEPQGALNIGSVCRVMMNFGFTDLRLVKPRADHLGKEARDMAVKAGELLKKARVFKTLAHALADCNLCFGTTRRFGRYRTEFLEPHEVPDRISLLRPDSRAALVFGREDSGLTTAELDLCQYFVTIPADPALPSLNLAQAAAICLYEVQKGKHAPLAASEKSEPADNKSLEMMYSHMRESLLAAEYLDPQNPDHILHAFRRLFGRAGLDQREVRILQGLWSRIDWLNSRRIR